MCMWFGFNPAVNFCNFSTLLTLSFFAGATSTSPKFDLYLDRVKRIWYLSHMRAATVQASLRMRAVSPEPPLLAHTSSESRGTFRQKARSLAPLNGWACAIKICHDGMLEDTNSLDGVHLFQVNNIPNLTNHTECGFETGFSLE